jgi:predicted SnoaL-like aldol condensation-catalyzing enzyme
VNDAGVPLSKASFLVSTATAMADHAHPVPTPCGDIIAQGSTVQYSFIRQSNARPSPKDVPTFGHIGLSSEENHVSGSEQSMNQLEANKALTVKLMELLVDPTKADQAREILTDEYVQHNPDIPSGADAIIAFAKSEAGAQARNSMRPSPEPPVLIAEGDLVVQMIARDLPDPDKPGETYRSYWFDLWRVEDGRLAEHWDAAPKTPGGLSI